MKLTIWISGISASGKTTLGTMLSNSLIELGENVTFFDGDTLRKKLKRNYGHNIKDRYEILNEYIEIILKEMNQNKIVIISTISHKKDMRVRARKKIFNFFEVILKCSSNTCAKRDYKNQYKKAYAGDYPCFPGVTEKYEISDSPELIIDTEKNNIGESFKILLKNIKKHLEKFKN